MINYFLHVYVYVYACYFNNWYSGIICANKKWLWWLTNKFSNTEADVKEVPKKEKSHKEYEERDEEKGRREKLKKGKKEERRRTVENYKGMKFFVPF